MPSLTKASASGVAWLLAQSGGARVVGFFSQIVLARLLVPSDFGDVAMASSVSAVISTVVGFGADDVLLSRSRRIRMWFAPAFLTSLFFSFVGAAALLAIGPVAAKLYRSPRVLGLLAVMALSMPLGALSAVPTAYLRSHLRFRFIATYGTAELVTIQLATIALAWSGLGAFSFVIPYPMAALIKVVVFWKAARPPMNWRVRRRQLHIFVSNGAAVFAQQLITSLRNNGDYILLGIFATKSSVGMYFMAFRLAAAPVYTLVNGMSGVLFPALAQLRDEPRRQLAAALSASRVIALAVIPLSFLQAGISVPFVRRFLGEKWGGAGPMLAILSIGLAFDVVPCVAGALMTANGKFRENWVFAGISSLAFFTLIGLGCASAKATGVALAVALFFVIFGPLYSYYALHLFGASARDVAAIYLPPALCSTAAVGLGLVISQLPLIHDRDIETVGVVGLVVIAVYGFSIQWVSPVAAKQTMEKVSVIFHRAA
jgi:O-antigen/teichoic acid export membrane protein